MRYRRIRGISNPVEFHYRLRGTGWSEAFIGVAGQWANPTASYLGDALGELLEAVDQLLDGASSATVVWEEEPGEYEWRLEREDDLVEVSICSRVHQPSKIIFDARPTLIDFAAAVASGARTVLDAEGEIGYKRAWVEHPFPTATLESIEQKLSGISS